MDTSFSKNIVSTKTGQLQEELMAELIAAYPPTGPAAKISRDERIADELDEEWIPDRELMEDLESLGS